MIRMYNQRAYQVVERRQPIQKHLKDPGLYRRVGSLTVLEVAQDNEQKSEDAQHGNSDPEIEHEIWQVFELLGAKRDLSVRKKFGEFGDPAGVTCADESLKNFSVRPIAHVEHSTGEQRSYCSAHAKPEV